MTSLSPVEIATAQAKINSKPAGVYELKELYGSAWSNIISPTTFGARFKQTVKDGLLQKINLLTPPKTNNHNTY